MKTNKRLAASLIAVTILCGVFFASLGAAPAADAANWCKAQEILLGDTFSPDTAMTRATVAGAFSERMTR